MQLATRFSLGAKHSLSRYDGRHPAPIPRQKSTSEPYRIACEDKTFASDPNWPTSVDKKFAQSADFLRDPANHLPGEDYKFASDPNWPTSVDKKFAQSADFLRDPANRLPGEDFKFASEVKKYALPVNLFADSVKRVSSEVKKLSSEDNFL